MTNVIRAAADIAIGAKRLTSSAICSCPTSGLMPTMSAYSSSLMKASACRRRAAGCRRAAHWVSARSQTAARSPCRSNTQPAGPAPPDTAPGRPEPPWRSRPPSVPGRPITGEAARLEDRIVKQVGGHHWHHDAGLHQCAGDSSMMLCHSELLAPGGIRSDRRER